MPWWYNMDGVIKVYEWRVGVRGIAELLHLLAFGDGGCDVPEALSTKFITRNVK